MLASRKEPLLLLIAALGITALSGISPHERGTWLMEVAPVFLGAALLVHTRARFPMTLLAYRLLLVHAIILAIGGHYTYALAAPGEWVKAALDLARNPYDRLGHFAQGFVPAIVAREILLRTSPLRPGRWLAFLVSATCLAISACYEFIEWWAALLLGQGADAFLGTQGDPWDTQWDMFLALIGSIVAQALLARRHDRELAGLRPVQ